AADAVSRGGANVLSLAWPVECGGGGALSGVMDLSVVIPVRNEAGNIAPLIAEIVAALEGLLRYEIVYVDDGSDDATAEEIRRAQPRKPQLRLVRHDRSYGQSTAMRSVERASAGRCSVPLVG